MKQQRYSTEDEMDAYEYGLLVGIGGVLLIEALVLTGVIVGWFLR